MKSAFNQWYRRFVLFHPDLEKIRQLSPLLDSWLMQEQNERHSYWWTLKCNSLRNTRLCALGWVHCVPYINALISHFTLWQVFLVLGPAQGPLSFYGQVLWVSLRCWYGTPPAKQPWTNCSMPKSMCKYCSFCFSFAPAWLTALVLFSYSEQGLIQLSHCEEAVHIEQESSSFDQPHFLVYY